MAAHRTRQEGHDEWRGTITADHLITLAQAAVLVRVTYGTAWSWWRNERIPQATHPSSGEPLHLDDGKPLFWVRDVWQTEASVRSTRRGRPRLVPLTEYL